MIDGLSPEELDRLLERLPPHKREEALELMRVLQHQQVMERFDAGYLRTLNPDWIWNKPFHERLFAELDRITRGENKRLIITLPPRHGKSELVTIRYAVWRIERDGLRVILGCYNQELATDFGKMALKVAKQRGLSISADTKAGHKWAVDAPEGKPGGSFLAAGVGSGVTGKGAELIIVDDPVKSREEADNPLYRERCWKWFTNDLMTRQNKDCAVIVIMTRWHFDDLAGRILRHAEETGEAWTVVDLPALALQDDLLGRTLGEALFPERVNAEFLGGMRRLMGERDFWALYQGRPLPEEGAMFRRDTFRPWTRDGECYVLRHGTEQEPRYERVPVRACWVFQTADLAGTTKTTSDYTAIATWAVTPKKQLLLLHVERVRLEAPDIPALFQREYAHWRPVFIAVGKTGLGVPIVQWLIQLGLPVRGHTEVADKKARAGGIAARYGEGTVFHPGATEAAPWLRDYESELLEFDAGAHDDMVDCASLADKCVGRSGQVFPEYSAYHEDPEVRFVDSQPLVVGWAFPPTAAQMAACAVQPDPGGGVETLHAWTAQPEEGMWEFIDRVDRGLGELGVPRDHPTRHVAHPCHTGVRRATHSDAWLVMMHGVKGEGRAGKPGWGWRLLPAEEDPLAREELIRSRLSTLRPGGVPTIRVSPAASPVVEALAGGYRYREGEGGLPSPEKVRDRHHAVVEALGMALASVYLRARKESDEDPDRRLFAAPATRGGRPTSGRGGACRAPGQR